MLRPFAHALPLLSLLACGGGGDDDDVAGTCADPEVNPFAGTCVSDAFADCFDPAGACEGTYDMTGSTTLTWENGAQVVGSVSGTTATTQLLASDGTVCAEAVSTYNTGDCQSETVYTLSSGQSLRWCINADSWTVTCPDGTAFDMPVVTDPSAMSCAYGEEAEPCTMTQASR
jgi:hypothetical protein